MTVHVAVHGNSRLNIKKSYKKRKDCLDMSESRGRAYTRYQRNSHINRKKRIIHDMNDYWYYRYDGILSKGKIHCSCPMCRLKYREYTSKHDKSRLLAMNYSLDTALKQFPIEYKIVDTERKLYSDVPHYID